MTGGLAVCLLLCGSGEPPPADNVVYCDVVELNHYYQPDNAATILVQWLMWDRDPRSNSYMIVAWRVHGKGHDRFQLRKRDGGSELAIRDSEGSCFFVRAPEFRETWTPYDPEVANRKSWPVAHRRGLKIKSVRQYVERVFP
jgi:hypothetical protein